MDLVNNPVHDALQELPGEVEGLGRHEVCCCHGAEDNNLTGVSGVHILQKRELTRTYVAVNSLVTHDADCAAGVDSGIGLGDLVVETGLADLGDVDL